MSTLVLATDHGAAPPVDWIVAFGIATVVSVLGHWRFKTGWKMANSRLAPSPYKRDLVILLGFTALPGALASACMTVLLLMGRLSDDSLDQAWVAGSFLLISLVFVASAAWLLKEIFWPSRRRAPEWLMREGWSR